MLAVGISSADSGPNAIQNGDFTTGGAPAADWTQVDVNDDPSGCDAGPPGTTGASGSVNCNGPYVYIAQSSPGPQTCDPLPAGTPFLSEDVPDTSDAYIDQQVTVPAGAALSFETWGYFQPSTASVSLVSAGGQVTQLDTVDEPLLQGSDASSCSGASAAQVSINMSAYAGQTVTLRFEGTSPNAIGTYVNYDDITLIGGTSTSTPTQSTTTPSTTSPSTTTPTTTPTTTTPGKLKSATSVFCNLDVQTSIDDCGATVADAADGVSTPTGNVTFTDGGVGSLLGSTCQLVPTPYSEGVASCVIQYRPVETNRQPTISATYVGNSSFDSSSGQQELKSGASTGPTNDTACTEDCSTSVVYPNEVDPVTGEPLSTEDVSKDTGSGTEGETASPEELEEGGPTEAQLDAARAASDQGLSGGQKSTVSGDTTGQATYGAAQTTSADQAISQGVAAAEQTESSGNGSNLAATDSDLNGAFSDSADSDARRLGPTAAGAVNLGPSPALVLSALSAARPSPAALAAFRQDLALATAPVYSPSRAVARVTLLLGAELDLHVIARDLGVTRLSKLSSARTVTLGSATRLLRAHAQTRLTIAPTALGARILRYLAVVGLSHHATVQLTVAVTPTRGRRHTSRLQRPIKVL